MPKPNPSQLLPTHRTPPTQQNPQGERIEISEVLKRIDRQRDELIAQLQVLDLATATIIALTRQLQSATATPPAAPAPVTSGTPGDTPEGTPAD